ncbi:MAG: 4a-hydroxytetrahydrobiopterin dehydratase [Gemmatimonadales bacterium]
MTAKDRVLSDQEIASALSRLSQWLHVDGVLRRVYATDGWRGSMLAANAAAFICEAADHHADLLVSWPKVTVSLATHSAGGITAKDVEVAGLIEAQLTWRPGPDSSLTGPADPFIKR